MDVNFSALYNKDVASSVSLLEELIIDVHNEIIASEIGTKWDKVGDIDGYYFSIVDPANKKNKISFGIWNELWVSSGFPLCLSFQLNSIPVKEIINSLVDFIDLNELKNLEVIETENIVSICFSEEYLIEIKYLKDIVNLIIALVEKFSFSFTINKKKW